MNGMDVYRDMTLFSFIDMCTLGKISSPLKAHMVTKYKSRVQILMKVSEQWRNLTLSNEYRLSLCDY